MASEGVTLPLQGNSLASTHGQETSCFNLKRRYKEFKSQLYTQEFSDWDVLFVLFAVATFIADIGTDLGLALTYFTEAEYWWFALTLSFILLPSLVLQLFSLRWLCQDKKPTARKSHQTWLSWIARCTLHFLQLGTVVRCLEALRIGHRSRTSRDHALRSWYYLAWVAEWTDVCLLRMFEAFLESAPQLVLQLYIMQVKGEADRQTVISCCISITSLASSLISYHRSLRDALPNAKIMNYTGVILWFLWRLLTVSSRVLAIAVFAHLFTWWIFVGLSLHFILMFVWLIFQKTKFYGGDRRAEELGFDFIIAFLYIFCWLNMKESRSRYRALLYYLLVYAENVTFVGLWYWKITKVGSLYAELVLLWVMFGFLGGIAFMALYYLLCHPKKIPFYVPPCSTEVTRQESSLHDIQDRLDCKEQAVKLPCIQVMREDWRPRGKRPNLSLGFAYRWRAVEEEGANG
ncbi:PREDICTED: XK-related protein 6-like [Branchiostoma belcheri]|uniref:XK-related protein n=1 Tax=Branchiostoma belcheri TaxID=7741 RepID=A0A6P4ZXD0_BRABE|nr:PREDICTED: XK-related protein 6-like [Branchiostoma belcheri]